MSLKIKVLASLLAIITFSLTFAQAQESFLTIAGQPYPGGNLGSPFALDTDADGNKEVYFSEFFSLQAFEANGQQRQGFPVNLQNLFGTQAEIAGRLPTFSDLNQDNQIEIILPLRVGPLGTNGAARVFALTNRGQLLTSWPAAGYVLSNNDRILDRAVIATLANIPHIAVPIYDNSTQQNKVIILRPNGTLLRSITLPGPVGGLSGPSIGLASGDLDNDGNDEVVAISGRRLHLLDLTTGANRPNFPVISFSSIAFANDYPALGDIDGDGFRDIVVFDQTTSTLVVRVLNRTAQNVSGWPVSITGTAGWQRPTLADVTGDSRLDIISLTSMLTAPFATNVFVHRHDGSLANGWPRALPEPVHSLSEFVTAADLTADLASEVIVRAGSDIGANPGAITVIGSTGNVLMRLSFANFAPNTQIAFLGQEGVVPSDLLGNGNAEIVFGMQAWNINSLNPTLPSDLPIAASLDSAFTLSAVDGKSWRAVDADTGNTRSLPPDPTMTPTVTATSTITPTPTPTSTATMTPTIFPTLRTYETPPPPTPRGP